MSREMLLYRYNQHALSGSAVFVVGLFLVGFHGSAVGFFSGNVVLGFIICLAGSVCVGIFSY